MPNDIFSENQITDENEFEDVTAETLVGETQKYKTIDDLAKAYSHADAELLKRQQRITEVEAENKVIKDLLEARGAQKPAEEQKPVVAEHDNREQRPAPKPEDISELVRKELQNASAEERRSRNINLAAEEMNKHYGSASKAQEAIRARATELNVGFDWLKDMASTSPQAFLASMGVTGQRSSATPGYSNEVTPSSGRSVRDFKYFEELRKKAPKTFYSSEVQKQMFAARRELGDKFFST